MKKLFVLLSFLWAGGALCASAYEGFYYGRAESENNYGQKKVAPGLVRFFVDEEDFVQIIFGNPEKGRSDFSYLKICLAEFETALEKKATEQGDDKNEDWIAFQIPLNFKTGEQMHAVPLNEDLKSKALIVKFKTIDNKIIRFQSQKINNKKGGKTTYIFPKSAVKDDWDF